MRAGGLQCDGKISFLLTLAGSAHASRGNRTSEVYLGVIGGPGGGEVPMPLT